MIEEFEILDQDFIAKVQKLVWDEYFSYFNLISAIDAVLNGNVNLYDAYILTENNSWVIGLRIDGHYMIYSKDFTSNQFQAILDRNNFNLFQNGYRFVGTKNIIEKIQSSTSLTYTIFKDRIFYSCDKVNSFNKNPLLSVEEAKTPDLDELSKMVCNYFEDEYHGKNNKDLEVIKEDVSRQISLGNKLWTLKSEGNLKSMCSIIPTHVNVPIIGSFFTKRESRNLGFGKNLLFEITKRFLKQHNQCWLIADSDNAESIAVFEKVGYKPVYKTLEIIVNND